MQYRSCYSWGWPPVAAMVAALLLGSTTRITAQTDDDVAPIAVSAPPKPVRS